MLKLHPYREAFLLMISLAFFISLLPNSWPYLIFKILLVVAAAAAVYYYGNQQNIPDKLEEHPEQDDGLPKSDLVKLETDREVEKIFEQFLDTVFPLIKQTLVADTVCFLLLNLEKKKFYLRYFITDHSKAFHKERFYDLQTGLPPLVLKNRTSLIENHLPENGNRLLPYYQPGKSPARSFAGVPVQFEGKVLGVLCVDAHAVEAFGQNDLQLLERFAQLIELQLVESNQLYEYETENWIARILNEFSNRMVGFQSTDELWDYLGRFLKQYFHADRVFVVRRAEEGQGRIVFSMGDVRGVTSGYRFQLHEGLVGWVLRKRQHLLVEDLATKQNYIPRFSLNEEPAREYRSLIAIPFQGEEHQTMALVLESFQPGRFKVQYKNVLETITNQVTIFLLHNRLFNILQQRNLFDLETDIGNFLAFKMELQKEIDRCQTYQRPFSVTYFQVEFVEKEHRQELRKNFIREFLSFLLPYLDNSNYIFRLHDNLFAVLWVEKPLAEITPTVQRICQAVAERPVWSGGHVVGVNVACGGVEFPTMGCEALALMVKAEKAVRAAIAAGKNQFKSYEANK